MNVVFGLTIKSDCKHCQYLSSYMEIEALHGRVIKKYVCCAKMDLFEDKYCLMFKANEKEKLKKL